MQAEEDLDTLRARSGAETRNCCFIHENLFTTREGSEQTWTRPQPHIGRGACLIVTPPIQDGE